jgi:hypothetical protein
MHVRALLVAAAVAGVSCADDVVRCNDDDDCAGEGLCLDGTCVDADGVDGDCTDGDDRCTEPPGCTTDGSYRYVDVDDDGVTAPGVLRCTNLVEEGAPTPSPAARPLRVAAATGTAADVVNANAIDGAWASLPVNKDLRWRFAGCDPNLTVGTPFSIRVVVRGTSGATAKIKLEHGVHGGDQRVPVENGQVIDAVVGGATTALFVLERPEEFCAGGTVRLHAEGGTVDVDGVEVTAYFGDDCDDADARRSIRAQGYSDVDVDGWGGVEQGGDCHAATAYATLVLQGGDCDDTQPLAHPGAGPQATPVNDDVGFDWDCDDDVEPTPATQRSVTCPVAPPCVATPGEITIACGETVDVASACVDDGDGGCATVETTTTQTCR